MAFAAVSIDIDPTWCYREIHGLPPHTSESIDPIYKIAVPRMLGFFATLDIPVTLFVIGKDVQKRGQAMLLREAAALGNELANHSFSHNYSMRKMAKHEIREDIRKAHELISDLTDERVVGFRTPGYNLSGTILSVLSELHYRYDSSILPSPAYYSAKLGVMSWLKLRRRPSRSGVALPHTLVAPRTPYKPSPRSFWRVAQRETKLPLEVPMAVVPGVGIPVIGTSLHLMSGKKFSAVFPLLKRAYPDLLNLEFHAIDFVDASDLKDPALEKVQPDLSIPWEKKRATYEHVFRTVGRDYSFATLRESLGL